MKFNSVKKIFIKGVWLIAPALFSPLAIATDGVDDEFRITGGSFFMGTVTAETIVLSPGDSPVGAPGVLIEGTYQGEPGTPDDSSTCTSDRPSYLFDQFLFFGGPVCTYTAQTGVDNGNHIAPHIDLTTGTADMSSFYAFWGITEFNQGSGQSKGTPDATVIDNFDGTYKFFWSSLIVDGSFDGKTGDWVLNAECLTCPPSAAGASVRLEATQASQITQTATNTDGDVVITTDLADTAGYIFNWSQTNDALDGGAIITGPTLTIAPAAISEGVYNIKVLVSNNNTDPIEKSAATMLLKIVANGDLTLIGDSDNDGIPNAADPITDPAMLQTRNGDNQLHIMTTTDGALTLGDTAICTSQISTEVSLNDIKNNAAQGCTAPPGNVSDTFGLDEGAVVPGIGGYRDFVVRDVVQGSQIQVVIPMTTAIAKNAGYRSYSGVDGWKAFNTNPPDENAPTVFDSIASIAGSPGECPAATDAGWSDGLTQGHYCMRLSITDGGLNDADGQSNGVVVSTATTVTYAGINSDLVEGGCSMSTTPKGLKNHADWLLVMLSLIWLGFVVRRNRA